LKTTEVVWKPKR